MTISISLLIVSRNIKKYIEWVIQKFNPIAYLPPVKPEIIQEFRKSPFKLYIYKSLFIIVLRAIVSVCSDDFEDFSCQVECLPANKFRIKIYPIFRTKRLEFKWK